MAIGLVAGGLGLFLLDPVVGGGRRAQLAQRAKAALDDLQRTIDGRSRDLRNGVRSERGCGRQHGGRHDSAAIRGQDAAAERRGECHAARGRERSGARCCRHRGALTGRTGGQAAATGSRRARTPRCRRAGVKVNEAAISATDNATRSHRLVW